MHHKVCFQLSPQNERTKLSKHVDCFQNRNSNSNSNNSQLNGVISKTTKDATVLRRSHAVNKRRRSWSWSPFASSSSPSTPLRRRRCITLNEQKLDSVWITTNSISGDEISRESPFQKNPGLFRFVSYRLRWNQMSIRNPNRFLLWFCNYIVPRIELNCFSGS